MMKRLIRTCLDCPIRCTRSIACASTAGDHHGSIYVKFYGEERDQKSTYEINSRCSGQIESHATGLEGHQHNLIDITRVYKFVALRGKSRHREKSVRFQLFAFGIRSHQIVQMLYLELSMQSEVGIKFERNSHDQPRQNSAWKSID